MHKIFLTIERYWLQILTLFFIALSLLLLMFSAYFYLSTKSKIQEPVIDEKIPPLPKNFFEQDPAKYKQLESSPFLKLQFSPMNLQLPDLKRYLLYVGKNGRPDADPSRALLHFSFTGAKETASISPKQPLYLLYDKDQPNVKYVFSPENQPTTLWIQATPKGNDVVVDVFMKNERGEILREPKANAEITLQEKPFAKWGVGAGWDIGKFKADSTLLSRQRARWYGKDLFFERHGGPEFADWASRERIDFESDEAPYSVYLGLDESMIWKGDQWTRPEGTENTQGYPLAQVKQIDDRLMKLDLWDIAGKNKVSLNLIKTTSGWNPKAIQKAFKFVGARTRSQFVFEIGEQRVTISPKDWLLETPDGWVKLTTPAQIDDYVDRKIQGNLFVFDGIERKDGKQVIEATLFSPDRTQTETLEIPIMQGGVPVKYVSEPKDGKKTDKEAPKPSMDERRRIWEERYKDIMNQDEASPVNGEALKERFRGMRGAE